MVKICLKKNEDIMITFNNCFDRIRLEFISLILVFLFAGCSNEQASIDNLKYVDPQIGGVAPLLQPTRTRIHLPNSMIRMYPERDDYLDDQITSFPLNLLKHRSNPVFNILPVSGATDFSRHPVSSWDHDLEQASPHYYSTWLVDFDITVEYSPQENAGFFHFTYPIDVAKYLFLREPDDGYWQLNGTSELVGKVNFSGMSAYAYVVLDAECELTTNEGNTWLKLNTDQEEVNLKYGFSYISIEQAKKNLQDQIPRWKLEEVTENGRRVWSEVINQIEVEGGTESYKRSFYTALYRSYERMINITENGRYYSNYDSTVHEGERDFYVDDWVWDTYLALHPLRFILDPEMEADMMSSYVRMYEQSGWLPQFPQVDGDAPPMNGFHSTIMLLDAWEKGIRDFDVETAYQGMKKNATHGTMVPWRMGGASELDTFYHQHGYFPALHPGEEETVAQVDDFEKRQAVAVTLGHSYDDWALAQMAKELGKTDDYRFFLQRSDNYKNLYWPEKGFFMPRDAEGNWIDIDPKFAGGMGGRDYYDENNGWTYLWNVQHDLYELQDLMGGKEIFEQRLDQLFREDLGRSKYALNASFPDFTGIVGQFSMGNEPSFHIPYLYNLTDSPWKTQKKIRLMLDTWFMDNIFGIPGDEDGGGMSAFVVFSAMGFYPITPGVPVYAIGSPLFSKITIHLPNGKDFIVSAPGCSEINKYIQSAKLNEETLNSPWFTHEDLANGGILELQMGAYPNKEWGTTGKDMPLAYSNFE